jgi:hypothetical protein
VRIKKLLGRPAIAAPGGRIKLDLHIFILLCRHWYHRER